MEVARVVAARISPGFDRNVFINCPFDAAYIPMFEAIVFAVKFVGFEPRCARERLDSSQIRIHKIVELIRVSRYSIHDLSRTELDEATSLPRFNMPLELGIDLGCKAFSRSHAGKSFLIFDAEQYRFQKYLSDISGQDIHRHDNNPKTAISRVRDWLRAESDVSSMPGGSAIHERYVEFRRDLPTISAASRLDVETLTFADFSRLVALWTQEHT
jgi:hypothetical protein